VPRGSSAIDEVVGLELPRHHVPAADLNVQRQARAFDLARINGAGNNLKISIPRQQRFQAPLSPPKHGIVLNSGGLYLHHPNGQTFSMDNSV
jgi:hypothetical protein